MFAVRKEVGGNEVEWVTGVPVAVAVLPEVGHLVHEKGLELVDGLQHAGREDVAPLAALVEGENGAAVVAA